MLAASFDFGAYPRLTAAFPFPHRVELEATLRGPTLTIVTTVRNEGEADLPVSFGFHPYLRLPGVELDQWRLEAPVRERLELRPDQLPTGRRESARIEPGPLGSRRFDDAFLAPLGGEPFALSGAGRRLELRMGDGYRFAQIFTPDDCDAVAFEPMTAPTNALVTGGPDLPLVATGESFAATFSTTVV